jgi:8-oxo-dGTP diphosphatase
MNMSKENRPQVGVGLLVVKDGGQVLIGTRKGSHGHGEHAGPGGHLELGETIEECALRELAEEVGPDIRVKNLGFLCFINMRRYMPKHYAHIQMVADWDEGEPQVMEPDKQEGWGWYDMNALPSPLFGTTNLAIEAYKTGKNFFEA